jgi:hypothetical protein
VISAADRIRAERRNGSAWTSPCRFDVRDTGMLKLFIADALS